MLGLQDTTGRPRVSPPARKRRWRTPLLDRILRRQPWLLDNLTFRKALNMMVAGVQYLTKCERMRAWPVVLKMDISPLCNLRCTVCVHAAPAETSSEALKSQHFHGRQYMATERFRSIVNQVKGKTSAISMYLYGDPLVHPDLDEMCTIASDAGINTHVSTNFSFRLSDERLRHIVESGLSHLTVCVDGLRQEVYELTRVGGKIDLVLHNLERLLEIRRELGRTYPKVEVQYIKFQHNIADLEEAERRLTAMGIDQFTSYWGILSNYTDEVPANYSVVGPRTNAWKPQCEWPHFMMTISYDGSVIPCCKHRSNLLYTDSDDKRIVGNAFESTIQDIWNSPEYRRIRRLVSNPQRALKEPELNRTYCEGCYAVYEAEIKDHVGMSAANHRWEDVYKKDDKNRVVRKSEMEVQVVQIQPMARREP